MPVKIIEHVGSEITWGIWHISESIADLEHLCAETLTAKDHEALDGVSHATKRKEFMGSRLLTKAILSEKKIAFEGIEKIGRKPYLIGRSHHLSISHAYPYAAVMIHDNLTCGIDIELTQERLWRIAHRFLNDHELTLVENNTNRLCEFWSAKEALYKKFGHLNLSFKDCMSLNIASDDGLNAHMVHNDAHVNQWVKMKVSRFDEFCIVYTMD